MRTILYHFRTRGTGAEAVHIAGIVRAFEKMGYQVILSSPTGVDPRKTAGSNPFAGAGSRSPLSKVTRLLPRGLFEILELIYNIPAFFRNLPRVLVHGPAFIYERHAFFLFSTAIIARLSRIPLVVEVNELVGDPRVRAQPIFSFLARWTDRFLFRRARLVVTVSPYLKRRIEQEYGVEPDRVIVLPNAVSEEELQIPPRSDIRSDFPPSAFLLGFAGWLVEWHRLDFLIEALATPEFASVVLVLIGDGPLRPSLEALAGRLGVPIHFTGPVSHSEVSSILREMDACIVPHSNAYRSPIKLFEFMAQERPVLAPRTEPIESILEDGKEGILFTPLEVESLRSAMRKLLGAHELRSSLGINARALVERNHTWEINARKIQACIA